MRQCVLDPKSAGLLLTVTLGCTSSCAHCCLSCEPGKVELRLSREEMAACVDQASALGIRGICFTGGEPVIYLADILPVMRKARGLGLYVDIRTNAAWAWSMSAARDVVHKMLDSGLGRLGFSYDDHHAAIPLKSIHNAIAVARERAVPFYLDWMSVGKSVGQVSRILGIEPPDELRTVGSPLRVGRATSLGDENFAFVATEALRAHPATCRDPSYPLVNVFPGGYVAFHPCCWVNPALLRHVNLCADGWMAKLVSDTASSPMSTFILTEGVTGLIKNAHPSVLKGRYSHACEACYDLLGAQFPDEAIGTLPGYIRDFYGTAQHPLTSASPS